MTSLKKGGRREHSSFNALEDTNTRYSIATTWVVHMTYTYAENSEKVSHLVLCIRGVCRRVGDRNIPQSMHWEDSNNQYSMLYSLAPQYEFIWTIRVGTTVLILSIVSKYHMLHFAGEEFVEGWEWERDLSQVLGRQSLSMLSNIYILAPQHGHIWPVLRWSIVRKYHMLCFTDEEFVEGWEVGPFPS